ncbi:hypothetical protein [Aliarcobacter butzleri]|uniref:hypothetical protein n=1 Tax=Aliarcobacter butzleri TaxID=28197 RepID=UPI0021B1DE21|nr:hypothetical protein [Aliarcobacter butzleri]MCT7557022.1 hypothetical protein [Aliarcobacter butzleri]
MLKRITLWLVTIVVALGLNGCAANGVRITDGSNMANATGSIVGLGIFAKIVGTGIGMNKNMEIYGVPGGRSHSWLTNELVNYCMYEKTGDKTFNAHLAKNFNEDWLNYNHPKHIEAIKCYQKGSTEKRLIEIKEKEKTKPEDEKLNFDVKEENLSGGKDEFKEIWKYENGSKREEYIQFMDLCLKNNEMGEEIFLDSLKNCSLKFKEKFDR